MSQDLKLLMKIDGFLAEFSRGSSRPEQKFLRELVLGILTSQSSLLSKIARALRTNENVKAIHKRLDRNLGQFDLSRAYERAQSRMLSKVDESFLFIFDPSEVVKPFAKVMEGLALVRDASEKPRRVKSKIGKWVDVPVMKPGYPLRVAIAMSSVGDVLPVELALYSFASEFFVSTNDENIQAMETLIHKTKFLPTLVLDREFDSYSIIRHLCHLRQAFIIRLKMTRKYRKAGEALGPNSPTHTREEMIGKFSYLEATEWITYSKKGKVSTHRFEMTAAHVELLSESKGAGVIRNPGDCEALTLVRVRIHKEKGIPVLYLLTNTKPKTSADLIRIARNYLARWNIEEYIRFLKQHFSLEGFLVRDLGRMKNIVRATYIATAIIHLLTDRRSNAGFKNHHRLLEQSLPVSAPRKSRDFFLYSYGMGLANIVALNNKLLSPAQLRPKPSDDVTQLKLRI